MVDVHNDGIEISGPNLEWTKSAMERGAEYDKLRRKGDSHVFPVSALHLKDWRSAENRQTNFPFPSICGVGPNLCRGGVVKFCTTKTYIAEISQMKIDSIQKSQPKGRLPMVRPRSEFDLSSSNAIGANYGVTRGRRKK